MKKIALLFPGQGSQKVGMGQDLHQEFGFVRELFDMAEETTRINLSRLCFQGPMAELTTTINLQPAITAVNLAFYKALASENRLPAITAGHSLGEYGALTAAGILGEEDTFKAVFRRGELMHRESLKHAGAMQAIIGFTIAQVNDLISRTPVEGPVSVANHNFEHQVVITGSPEPVTAVAAAAKQEGARTVPLKVSGAWHSQLIEGAMEDFSAFLDTVAFNAPQIPVIHNVTADLMEDPDQIRNTMARQLCSPVKWYDTMLMLMDQEVEFFVEAGPGKVLTGLLKKTLPKDYPAQIFTVNSIKSLESFFNATA